MSSNVVTPPPAATRDPSSGPVLPLSAESTRLPESFLFQGHSPLSFMLMGFLALALVVFALVMLWRTSRPDELAAIWTAAAGLALAVATVVGMMLMGLRHRKRAKLLLGILEDDTTPVALRDEAGRPLFVNQSFQDLLRLPGSAVLRTLLSRDGADLEKPVSAGGRWLRFVSRPVMLDAEVAGSLLVGMDETARLEAGEGRRFRAFAGLITHELKTPMTPLRLGLDQIQREVEHLQRPMPPGVQRILVRMRADLDNMSRLMRQFMALAGERRGEEPVDLRKAVEEALQRVGARQLPLLRCQVDLPDDPAWITGDPEMLAIVLSGLLANALEAQSREGVLEIRLSPGGPEFESWTLEILDEGPGIPAELLERIWEPGFSTRKDGYGYGLYFARTMIQDMRGQIRLERRPRGGTRVRIVLPRHVEMPAWRENPEEDSHADGHPHPAGGG